jgi:hypothetical protein
MTSLLRMLLVATALLTSGVIQVAAAAGDETCCGEEREGCPECPPGLACACCPMRGAVSSATVDVAPDRSHAVSVTTGAAEPRLRASVSDIFRPPRA